MAVIFTLDAIVVTAPAGIGEDPPSFSIIVSRLPQFAPQIIAGSIRRLLVGRPGCLDLGSQMDTTESALKQLSKSPHPTWRWPQGTLSSCHPHLALLLLLLLLSYPNRLFSYCVFFSLSIHGLARITSPSRSLGINTWLDRSGSIDQR